MPTKQDTAKIDAWKAENVDRIVIQPRKDRRFPDRIRAAVDQGKAASRQEYIIAAVEKALQDDNL